MVNPAKTRNQLGADGAGMMRLFRSNIKSAHARGTLASAAPDAELLQR
jgi:hypothetical protein